MAVSKAEIAAALGVSTEAVDALAAFASREQTSGRSSLDEQVAVITGLRSITTELAGVVSTAAGAASSALITAFNDADKARQGSGTSIKPDEAKAIVQAAVNDAYAAVDAYRQTCADVAEKLAGVAKG